MVTKRSLETGFHPEVSGTFWLFLGVDFFFWQNFETFEKRPNRPGIVPNGFWNRLQCKKIVLVCQNEGSGWWDFHVLWIFSKMTGERASHPPADPLRSAALMLCPFSANGSRKVRSVIFFCSFIFPLGELRTRTWARHCNGSSAVGCEAFSSIYFFKKVVPELPF